MASRLHSFLMYLGAAVLVCGSLYLFGHAVILLESRSPSNATSQSAAASASLIATTSLPSTPVATISTPSTTKQAAGAKPLPVVKPVTTTPTSASSTTAQAVRVANPYNTPPESFTTVNTDTRAALVNILCMPRGGGSLSPISGSGVIIDPRGVILTNAHVAQFVLLSEDSQVNLSCQIRTGDPATAKWTADVLYMPPAWVDTHASEINTAHPTGTGEHDYALLRITGAVNGTTLASTFPYLPYDTREAIGFLGDQVLGAGYPAEFLGGLAAENSLSPVSSVSPIDQLLTFSTSTVDVISIGGVVEAQSGSSGGAVVNQWGNLVGIITTTSDATTTAARDLRAITLNYIDRDLQNQTGFGLTTFLTGDLAARESAFNTDTARNLLQQYLAVLSP